MILVRVLVGLIIGIALRGAATLMAGGEPAPSSGEANPLPGPESAAPDDPGGFDRADAAAPVPDRETGLTEDVPDNARERAPRAVRIGMAVLPVLAALTLIGSLVAILASNLTWELPGLGVVEGNWPVGLLLLSVAVLAVWVLWQVPRWQAAAWRQGTTLGDREIFDIENSARSTLGQILSGVAVLAGLIFAWQQLGNTSETLFVSQQGQITDRFTRAVDQLGNADVTVRLGGIYALERISRDSERDHETVLEILAAFARQRSPAEQAAAVVNATPAGDPTAMLPSIRNLPLDIDVVLKVISRRDPALDGPDCINLSGIDLSGGDLAGYYLGNVCLQAANLTGANLRGANLAGVDLALADFTSANLDGANLSGATLTDAVFTSANLSQASLDDATLTGATLAGVPMQGTSLRGAMLNGADLSGALLAGTDFTSADLLDANLTGAVMSGANFTGARNLTAEQADSAMVDQTTLFPPGAAATPDF